MKKNTEGLQGSIRMCVWAFANGENQPMELKLIKRQLKNSGLDVLKEAMEGFIEAEVEFFGDIPDRPGSFGDLEQFINNEIQSRWQYKLDQQLYKVKAFIRWLRYQLRLGIVYETYSEDGEIEDMALDYNVGGYVGWYEARGHCIAFRNVDGNIQFKW